MRLEGVSCPWDLICEGPGLSPGTISFQSRESSRARTCDTTVKSRLLCQLSYGSNGGVSAPCSRFPGPACPRRSSWVTRYVGRSGCVSGPLHGTGRTLCDWQVFRAERSTFHSYQDLPGHHACQSRGAAGFEPTLERLIGAASTPLGYTPTRVTWMPAMAQPDFSVGTAGFEPTAFRSQSGRATRLRYVPMSAGQRAVQTIACPANESHLTPSQV